MGITARYGMLRRLCQPLLLALIVLMTSQGANAAPPKMVLAFGDSLTAGYQLRPAESFPAQLEAALRAKGTNVTVHNAGVSGDTSAQGRARLGWVLAGLKATPDLAIVELGANDMLRGEPPAAMAANLDAILAELGKRRIPVLLAGMRAAPNLGHAYGREFEAVFPALAKKHGAALYPFFLDGVAGVRGLQLSDGMHPTAKGVAAVVRRILPTVDKALATKR